MAPLTVRAYQHDVALFLRWLEEKTGAHLALGALSELDLLNYRQHLVNVRRLRPATINQRVQALRWLCRWARREGLVKTDPSGCLKSMRVARRRQPAGLAEPEVHALLRAAGSSRQSQGARNYALVHLLLQTGLRVGELASLRVGDVLIRERHGRVRVRLGKGEKERDVPLNATARRALRTYLDGRSSRRPEEPVFMSHRAQALTVRAIQALLATLVRRAKLTRIPVTPHTLRHTFALGYLRQNPGKLVELAHLLGHDSLGTTAIYTQPSTEDLASDLEWSPLNVYG
jgi:integrase/recombinase XerC